MDPLDHGVGSVAVGRRTLDLSFLGVNQHNEPDCISWRIRMGEPKGGSWTNGLLDDRWRRDEVDE